MLPDHLKQGLDVVFVGTSVATASASRGHYYAGPGNKFWEFLWEAGLTGERLLITEQDAMVLEYRIGLTTWSREEHPLRIRSFELRTTTSQVSSTRSRISNPLSSPSMASKRLRRCSRP